MSQLCVWNKPSNAAGMLGVEAQNWDSGRDFSAGGWPPDRGAAGLEAASGGRTVRGYPTPCVVDQWLSGSRARYPMLYPTFRGESASSRAIGPLAKGRVSVGARLTILCSELKGRGICAGGGWTIRRRLAKDCSALAARGRGLPHSSPHLPGSSSRPAAARGGAP
jgi:hypothetical protein